MSAAPSVAAVIVSYNSEADLGELLARLAGSQIEVIVVDNASTDHSAAVARAAGAATIELPTNLGWAVGCNVGARQTPAEVLVFVNPDARPDAEDLVRLATALGEPGIGLTAPRFIDFSGAPQAFYFRFPTAWSGLFCFFAVGARIDRMLGRRFIAHRHYGFAEMPDPVDQPGAACVAVRAADFAQLGGFDEAMFLFFADTDLCLRLAATGKRVRVVWDVAVGHRQGGSVVALDDTTRAHHVHRDYLVYARRHYRPAARMLTICAYVVLGGVLPACAKLIRGQFGDARRVVTLTVADLARGRAGRRA